MGVTVNMIPGTPLVAGIASGEAVATDVPLSFWGGLDAETGDIIDRHHPLCGVRVRGRILVLPSGRGSCSASGVLLEAIRHGVAPAGIIVSASDPIIALGCILAQELYGITVPVILVSDADRRRISGGTNVQIDAAGTIALGPEPGTE